MKTKLITITLLISISSLVLACPNNCNQRQMGKHHRQHVQELLNLTDEQQQKFDAVMQEERESGHKQMQHNHEQTKLKLAQFLSADQMKILEENRPRRMPEQKRRREK